MFYSHLSHNTFLAACFVIALGMGIPLHEVSRVSEGINTGWCMPLVACSVNADPWKVFIISTVGSLQALCIQLCQRDMQVPGLSTRWHHCSTPSCHPQNLLPCRQCGDVTSEQWRSSHSKPRLCYKQPLSNLIEHQGARLNCILKGPGLD